MQLKSKTAKTIKITFTILILIFVFIFFSPYGQFIRRSFFPRFIPPIPDYLKTLDVGWDLLERKGLKTWRTDRSYFRYQYRGDISILKNQLRNQISGLEKWNTNKEYSHKDILGLFSEQHKTQSLTSSEEKTALRDLWIRLSSESYMSTSKYQIQSEGPYSVMIWKTKIDQSKIRTILIRIIPESQSNFIEIFDQYKLN